MRQDRRLRRSPRRRRYPFALAGLLAFCLIVWLLAPMGAAAAMAARLPANATCAQLAHTDPTVTNGAAWGTALLPGFGAAGGWFGVPVCANSVNQIAPGGANVSCDRVPTNFAATGCAPGGATEDGYGWSFQCVELVIRFTAWAFGSPTGDWHGDAQYLWLRGNHPASFTPYLNGGMTPPVPGDILVWGSLDSQGRIWPAGPAGGHVAVVSAAGAGSISFVEENMLGRAGNIPQETTALTQSGGHWTIGYTYATNGGRALYGWLHQAGNDGRFAGSEGQPPASAGPVVGVALPSLAQAMTITGSGALTQLVWSDIHTASHPAPTSGVEPGAVAQSLGTPPGEALDPNQRPAVVVLPDGARYIFARGQNGRLYAAYTPGDKVAKKYRAEVLWQDLGAPAGLTLTSGASAVWDGREIVILALGSDGAMWTRSGPPGLLGQWANLGASPAGPFTQAPALARESAPAHAASASGGWWVALAVGPDGALFEADGHQATGGADAPTATSTAPRDLWSAWSAVNVLTLAASLTGPIFAFTETTENPAGQTSVDALVPDTIGALCLLHRGAPDQAWQARSFPSPAPGATLLAATLDPGAPGGPALTAYLSDTEVRTSPTGAQLASEVMLAGDLPIAAAAQTPSWESLDSLQAPSAGRAATPPVAFSTGAGQRALLVSRASQVLVTGDGPALELLAPGANIPPGLQAVGESAFPTPEGAGTVDLGAAPPAAPFSDNFAGPALDPRWVTTDGPATAAALSAGTLALSDTGGSQGASLIQGALPGNGSVSVWVTPGESWRDGGTAQAGIALSLDAWNGVAFSIRADGSAALCPTLDSVTQPCQSVPAPAALDGQRGLLLRVTRSGATLSAAISADGTTWTAVGTWRAPWLPVAGGAMGAYAPLIAPSGSANPGGYGATPLEFTSVSLFVSGAVQAASGGQAVADATGASARFSAFTASETSSGAA